MSVVIRDPVDGLVKIITKGDVCIVMDYVCICRSECKIPYMYVYGKVMFILFFAVTFKGADTVMFGRLRSNQDFLGKHRSSYYAYSYICNLSAYVHMYVCNGDNSG